MMLSRLLVFILSVFMVAESLADTTTAPYRRQVSFEWEAIENARGYDIELQQIAKQGEKTEKAFTFKTKEASWNGRLKPGKYIMKLRTRDYRGVPGEWSEPSDFNVDLDRVLIKAPVNGATIPSTEKDQMSLNFAWDAVPGADIYHIEIISADEKTKISKDLKETTLTVDLPVAQEYTWKISAATADGIQSEAITSQTLTVQGAPVAAPKITSPENPFVRELTWSRPDHVEGYDLYLLKYNKTEKKWDKVQVMLNYQNDTLPFDMAWSGGLYQLILKAKAPIRENSELSKIEFFVHEGDRSPASEYVALVRKSIERVSGWYGIASYLITQMQFKGTNSEMNSSVSYTSLGGTGRVGAGWLSPDHPWGFLGSVDLTGITLHDSLKTFGSLELNAIYRQDMGDRGELRIQFGPYYKELPETWGDSYTNTSYSGLISAIGSHVGAEYWYSLSPKVGVQINTHLYASLLGTKIPNGQELKPQLSHQIGFMGSYRFTSNFTGLIGYALREDRLSYKAQVDSSNFAEEGDVNETVIRGHYLNLFAEWAY